jgi:SAM-dependent methyltransferase
MITVDFKRINIVPGHRVLDIGCGQGRHAGGLSRMKGIFIVGADLNPENLTATKSRLELIRTLGENGGSAWGLTAADITALPFSDGGFDHVICSEVLEHIPDEAAAAAELIRVLKPGGNLIVSVPRFFPEKICWMLSDAYSSEEGGHIRIYTKSRILSLFDTPELKGLGSHFAHSLHTPYWWLKCLVGPARTDSAAVNLYHRFLTWDIMKKPRITRNLDRLLNPLFGKSLVVYFRKAM